MTATRRAEPQEARRFRVTFLAATALTLIAGIPLLLLALDARDDEPASSAGIVAVTAGGDRVDSGTTIEADELVGFEIDDPDLIAISWALYGPGDVELDRAVDTSGSPFTIEVGSASLGTGIHDLLITATHRDGSTVQRAGRYVLD